MVWWVANICQWWVDIEGGVAVWWSAPKKSWTIRRENWPASVQSQSVWASSEFSFLSSSQFLNIPCQTRTYFGLYGGLRGKFCPWIIFLFFWKQGWMGVHCVRCLQLVKCDHCKYLSSSRTWSEDTRGVSACYIAARNGARLYLVHEGLQLSPFNRRTRRC